MKQNANTTFGTGWMHHQLINILRVVDVRLLYLFAAIFIVPVCLLLNTNRSRTTAYTFFHKRIGYSCLRAAWAVYINHFLFAQVVIDRFAMFAGQHFKVSVVGSEHFSRLAQQTKGFVQLSAHVGCYEIAGYTLVAKDKRINALVFGGEKATIMSGRTDQFSHNNIRMIPVLPDMSHLFAINEALSHNEIVSMPADRKPNGGKTLTVEFLGQKAKIPMGPFSVPTMRSLDVLAVNVIKTSEKSYTAYVTPLEYDKQAPRKEQIKQLAEGYIRELERVVRQHPCQWFNFFDFWTTEEEERNKLKDKERS